MSNRRKSTAPTDVRTPLLAALDIEYARASKAKNLPRMEEIATIVRQLKGVWQDIPAQQWDAIMDPEPLPAPASAPVTPALPPPVLPEPPPRPAAVAGPEPAPLPLPRLPPPTFMAGAAPLQDILARADREPPLPDIAETRHRAIARIRDAVNEANRALADGRILYEQALMAKNSKIEPMSRLQEAAHMQGLTVAQLADRLIADYDRKGRRTIYVYTRQTQALRDIDEESDEETIAAIANEAVKGILEDDDT